MVRSWVFMDNKYMQDFARTILSSGRITAFIETGTHEGHTSGWIARNSKVRVLTCEKDPVKYRRLSGRLPGVAVFEEDSPLFLEKIRFFAGECPLFYLDAHSTTENPLPREIAVIERYYERAVWIAHDFAVPFEPAFSYHDERYEPEFVNRWENVLPLIDVGAVRGVYFPAYKPYYPATTGYVIVFRSVEPFAVDIGCLQKYEWWRGRT